MENNPLISVIVPIYKVEEFLPTCLDSILAQTYKNLEIILVDDGSPDNCGMICDEYAKKDSRIIVIHKENGGLSDARNAGLDICTGDYISFVDSDDYVDKSFIESLYCNLSESKADLAVCFFRYVRPGEVLRRKTTHRHGVTNFTGNDLLNKLYDPSWIPANVVSWNKLYKRFIWDNLRFPVGKLNEDEYVIVDIYNRAKVVAVSNAKLYFYRLRDNSIMSNFSVHKFHNTIYLLSLRKAYFAANNKVTLERQTESFINSIYCKTYITHDLSECHEYVKNNLRSIFCDKYIPSKVKGKLLLKLLFPSLFTTLVKKYHR